MLKILIILAAVLTLISGMSSLDNEPSLMSALFLGISLSSFFFLLGIKDWSKDDKIGSYFYFFGSIVIFISMVITALNYL